MAGFGRSNSLSINTSGSLFGSNSGQAQQQASSSQPQTGGLFGGAPAAASQPPQSAGLFGALNKPATAQGTGTLFGASAQSQPQQQQSGGVFGGALGGNAQSGIGQTSQSGGLFGQQQQQQPQKPALSLFSNTQQQQQQPQQQQQQQNQPSLFGASTAQPQPQQNSRPSLFGATTQQQPQQQQQNTLFSSMQSARQPTMTLGGHTMTGPGLPSASTSGLNVTDISNVKGTTRYSDLDRSLQNDIQQVDDTIQGHISNATRVREILPGQDANVATIGPDVAYIEQFLSTVELGILNDSANIEHLKALVDKDMDDARLSIRAVENLKLPNQFHYSRSNLNASTSKSSSIPASQSATDPTKPVDLVSYFSARADELSRTHDTYNQQIREIELHLRTMEAGTLEKAQQLTGSRNGSKDQRKELMEALSAINGAIQEAAKKVTFVQDLVRQETS